MQALHLPERHDRISKGGVTASDLFELPLKEGQWVVTTERRYDVALSFAEEERAIARALAQALEARNIKVFFDELQKAEIWGKNLYDFLNEVYFQQARYCIMLVSEAYAANVWTNRERQSAQARELQETSDYILPIRIDDTPLPGLLPTVAYLSYDDYSVDELADLVAEKVADPSGQGPGNSKPGAEHFASMGDPIPDQDFGLQLGGQVIFFHSESGKVSECRGLGQDQEIWIISHGRDVGLNVPDSMLRARKGHFVSWITVAREQAFPECLVAAFNYSTRELILSGDDIRFLAATSIVGVDNASKTLQRAGKSSFVRAFGIAFVVLFLSILLTDMRWFHQVAFWSTLILVFAEPYISGAAIKARSREMETFIAGRYGFQPPP